MRPGGYIPLITVPLQRQPNSPRRQPLLPGMQHATSHLPAHLFLREHGPISALWLIFCTALPYDPRLRLTRLLRRSRPMAAACWCPICAATAPTSLPPDRNARARGDQGITLPRPAQFMDAVKIELPSDGLRLAAAPPASWRRSGPNACAAW